MPEVFSASKATNDHVVHQGSEHAHHGMSKKEEARKLIQDVLRRVGETKRSANFRSYVVYPDCQFSEEQSDEEVAMILRAHPIVNVKWIIGSVFMLLLPLGIELIGMTNGLPVGYVFVGKLIWYLLTMGYILEKFLHWYYSVLIITNERIVDIDFTGLLHRDIAYAALNHIEQPSLVSGGIWQSIFDFGRVKVETAAETANVEIENVPKPDKVLKIIAELSEELEKRRERGE